MEITPFAIYLIGIADNLKEVVGTIAILLSLGLGVSVLGYVFAVVPPAYDSMARLFKRFIWMAILCLTIFLPISILAPSSKVLMAMYVLPAVTQVEGIDQLPANTVRALNRLLEEYSERGEE